MEAWNAKGMSGAAANLYDGIVDFMTTGQEGQVSMDRDASGRVNKAIPVRFLQEELEMDKRSFDVMKSLEIFGAMALNYKHKSNIEDKVILMQRLINESLEIQTDASGKQRSDEEGNLFNIKDGLPVLKKAVEHAIDAQLYGKRQEVEGKMKSTIPLTAAQLKRKVSLKAQLVKLDAKHELGKLSKAEHTKMTKPIHKQLEELEGKNLAWSNIANTFIQYTQFKGMGYNVSAAVANLGFGVISNLVHAAGNEDYTTRELFKANSMLMRSSTNFKDDKIKNLVDKFDVLFEVNEMQYSGARKHKTAWSAVSPLEMQRRTEFYAQGMTLVAMMLNKQMKVKDLNGRETTLFEAFDEKGNWKTEQYGPNTEWSGDIANKNEMKEFRKFRDRVIQVNKRLHGNYDPASYPLIKRYALGRLAMQFRSWMFEGFATRFEPLKYDEQLGREVKGRYRTITDVGVFKSLNAMIKIALSKKDGLSDLSPVDQANLRKNVREALIAISFAVLGALLAAGIDDEDDAKTKFLTYTLNRLHRIESDIYFFISPDEFQKMLKSPIPMVRTLIELQNLATDIVTFDPNTGEKLIKATPYLSQVPRFFKETQKLAR
jgi:hypothetical protein